ncbi:RlpA-like double-psi beta-barrel-protein domain-containing protein-containing protein [Xylariaceae sp. FL1019]|nr:RlpA-like double-psi beta-barrel-protein domain-containing protein-containing protein [Xylariaceae sp. FL1019]
MSPFTQALVAITAVMGGTAHAATMRLAAEDLAVRAASITGDMTHYPTGLGACGIVNGEGDPIVAVSHLIFDPQTPGGNPNENPLCGRQVLSIPVLVYSIRLDLRRKSDSRADILIPHRIRISRNGKSVVVKVEDRCEGCGANDVDVPTAVFAQLDNPDAGRVQVTWDWI